MNFMPDIIRSIFNIPMVIGKFKGGTVRVTPRCSLFEECKYEITIKRGLLGQVDSLGFTKTKVDAELMGPTVSIRYDSRFSLSIGRTWDNPRMLPSIGS